MPVVLVHFAGRTRGDGDPLPPGVPAAVEDRLVRILEEGRIRASTNFTYRPAVCVSESSREAVAAFFGSGVNVRGSYEPWALLLQREPCIKAGLRPLIHATRQEIMAVQAAASTDNRLEKLLGRMIRYEPPSTDWMHEREWRFPFAIDAGSSQYWMSLTGLVQGVVTPELSWSPPLDRKYASSCQTLERFHWNGSKVVADGWLTLPT